MNKCHPCLNKRSGLHLTCKQVTPCLNKAPILHYGYTMDLYQMRDYLYACPDFALKYPELVEKDCVRKSFSLLEYLKERFSFLPGTSLYYFVSKPYKGDIFAEDDVQLFLGYKLETDDDIKKFRFWEGGLPFPQSDIDLKGIISPRPGYHVGFSA